MTTLSKDKLNSTLIEVNFKTKVSDLDQVGSSAIANRTAIEGSSIGFQINETAGGFVSLTVITNENDTVVNEPTTCLMTESVNGNGVAITRTSASKTDISTLTGKTVSDGFLPVVITHPSPKGIENALKPLVKNSDAIVQKMKQVSSDPQVVESLGLAADVGAQTASEVKKVLDKNRFETGNPFGSLSNPFSGAAGLPFANVLGNIAGVLTSSIQKTSGLNSVTKSLSPISFNSPNSLEPVQIIKEDGSTNISAILTKSSIISSSDVPSDSPFVIAENPVGWAGSNTFESEYKNVFTNVDVIEELESEIRKAFKFRPFTALLVSSSNSGLNQDLDAATVHKKDTEYVRNILAPSQLSRFGGIQSHYIIRRDGTIQRGRPLRLPLYSGSGLHGWTQRTISVMLIGGVNSFAPFEGGGATDYSWESYTTAQWESFEKLCKVFRAAVPGGEAVTIDEYSGSEKPNAHFSALDWTNTRFGWETLYVGNNDLKNRWDRNLGPMQLDEISKYVPERVAKPTSSLAQTKPATPKAVVQEKTDAEKEADQRAISNRQATIDKNESRILELEKELSLLKGDILGNSSRIAAITLQIGALKLENLDFEKSLESLRSNRHDSVTYAQTIFNQAQAVYSDEGTTEALNSLKQAETAVRQAVKSQYKENGR